MHVQQLLYVSSYRRHKLSKEDTDSRRIVRNTFFPAVRSAAPRRPIAAPKSLKEFVVPSSNVLRRPRSPSSKRLLRQISGDIKTLEDDLKKSREHEQAFARARDHEAAVLMRRRLRESAAPAPGGGDHYEGGTVFGKQRRRPSPPRKLPAFDTGSSVASARNSGHSELDDFVLRKEDSVSSASFSEMPPLKPFGRSPDGGPEAGYSIAQFSGCSSHRVLRDSVLLRCGSSTVWRCSSSPVVLDWSRSTPEQLDEQQYRPRICPRSHTANIAS